MKLEERIKIRELLSTNQRTFFISKYTYWIDFVKSKDIAIESVLFGAIDISLNAFRGDINNPVFGNDVSVQILLFCHHLQVSLKRGIIGFAEQWSARMRLILAEYRFIIYITQMIEVVDTTQGEIIVLGFVLKDRIDHSHRALLIIRDILPLVDKMRGLDILVAVCADIA